jgi:thiol reductant ABC exporter CydD subunit
VPAVDQRLLKCARPAKIYLATSVLLGVVKGILLISQAWLLATVIAGAFIDGKDLGQLRSPIELLLVVFLLRALVAWSQELAANHCSAKVKSTLRSALLQRAVLLGPDGSVTGRSGDIATLAVRGVDALDGYYARYLPQVVLAAVVPIAVLVAVFSADWVSGAIMLVTLPLVPIFMALVGMETQARTDRQLRALQLLSGHFLDVVSGLTTLKIFGRSKAQLHTIREVADSYRLRMMKALRVTFLSSLVLELLASVSVALVAVAIGLRLLAGHLSLQTSLFVLVLAPEAYLPLRQLGAEFHASSEGLSAAQQVFEVLDRPAPERGRRTEVPDPAAAALVVDGVRFTYPGRDQPAVDGATFVAHPGELVAITGPSGCGKSTLLAILLGFLRPDDGSVLVGGVDLTTLDPDAWRKRVAWVPQRPHLFAGTIADNVLLGRPGSRLDAVGPDPVGLDAVGLDKVHSDEVHYDEVHRALEAAGLSDLVAALPEGLGTILGERGTGLSAGERQRVALARAFLRDAPLLLLDEPTANLDGRTEAEVLQAVGRLAGGRTVVMVAHRPALLALADRVVDLSLVGAAV